MQLIHGDCLEEMKKMPDKSVDLVLTDPPYGMNYQSNWRINSTQSKNFEPIHGDKKYPSELIQTFKRVARKAVFSFCRWDNLVEVEKPKSFIVWDKKHSGMGDLEHSYGRNWEGILFYAMENHKFNSRPADVIRISGVGGLQMRHPTEKPTGVIKTLLLHNSDRGDTILDPFMGSGTTGVACKELGREFIGMEINKEYYEIAKRRIANTQESLF